MFRRKVPNSQMWQKKASLIAQQLLKTPLRQIFSTDFQAKNFLGKSMPRYSQNKNPNCLITHLPHRILFSKATVSWDKNSASQKLQILQHKQTSLPRVAI